MKPLLEALEASSVAVWDYDVPAGRIWLSPEWGHILGGARVESEWTPESLLALVPEADRAAVMAAWQAALTGESDSYRVEHRVGTELGLVWIASSGRVMERDGRGRVLRLVGTNAEITALKQAEAAVRETEARLRLIIDAVPGLIAYVDRHMTVRMHNKAYEDWLGLAADQIDGRHARDVIGAEAYEQTEAYARRAMSGERVSFERQQASSAWGMMHLAATFVPHRAPSGEVDGFFGLLVDITDRKIAEQKIAAMAFTDPLTGLPNRRLLDNRLAQAIALAARRSNALALLYLDLDGFKPVNDRLGHDAGDALLMEIAARLRAVVRGSDTVARVGGDEFVVLLVDPGSEGAASAKAAAMIEAVSRPLALPQGEVKVGASVGIALYPAHGGSAADLSRSADAAMYAAKRAGRGTWRFPE